MIKVAVIGTGGISTSHIEGYLRFPDRCRIVGMADSLADRAEAQKSKFNLDCRTTGNPLDFAGDPDIDLVSICTPPSTHSPLALAFLKAGKHVLLEKPMAASLAECGAMREEAKRGGRILSVVAQNRYRTPAMRIKKILDTGILGKINHIQVNSYWWRSRAYYDMDWRGAWASEGGGCTLNHSVHHIDLMLWFAGMPYEVVSLVDNMAHDNSEVEDLSMALFRFKPHALGQLTSSVVHYGEEQAIVIQAERASIAMPWRVASFRARDNGFPDGNDELFIKEINDLYESLPAVEFEGHAGQIDDVLSAIETGGEPMLTGLDGENAINVILGIYKSAFEKRIVELPLKNDDAFHTREGLLAKAVKFHEKSKSVAGFEGDIIVGGIGNQVR